MARFNHLHRVTPGILSSGLEGVIVRETENTIDLIIDPVKNSETTFYFLSSDFHANKHCSIEVNFRYEAATVHIFGLYELHDKKHIKIKTTMNHFVPHCTSKQLWKGVMHDASKAAFEGKIIVHPQAQKTHAQLANKNLLLSQQAEINTKPELEIYADDVTCSHGATIGCLDDNALFYLRSRGIEENEARAILVKAFIEELYDIGDL